MIIVNMLVAYIETKNQNASKRNGNLIIMNWEVYPEGIYHILKKYNSYPQVKNIIITENGAAFKDFLNDDKIADIDRLLFLKSYLSNVLKAKREGVHVNGYFVWSFTDNFEWAEGFEPRFGLVYIDYESQKRVVKDSGKWYQKFLSQI